MKSLAAILALTFSLSIFPIMSAQAEDSVHEFTVKDINGEEVNLSQFKGKPLLIVNVASRCGATPQYATLVELHKAFAEKGLVVMGFPANNFGGQEPGTNEEIKTFCATNYGVDFPMFSKVSVKGDDMAPLFQYLTSAENPDKQGDIGWNFEKFLIGKDGKLKRRFKTGTQPDAPEVVEAIEAAIQE